MHDQLPGSLRLASTFPFVGRSRALETLRSLVPHAENEGRRVALVGGEAGSGKSRLVREFAAGAADDGCLVLYGACDAVVRTPYGPFVEALDHLARVADPDELRGAIGPGGGELTRLLPDLPARIGDLPAPVDADPDTERHRLHMAVTDVLAGISRERPIVLVLEDGHWADAPTLLLLRHLTRAAGDARLLILATFRHTEADVPEALADTLADLRRSDDVAWLRLAGLSPEEVAEFVRRAAGGELGPDLELLAKAISELTEGNPFLLCEQWRDLIETEVVEAAGGSLRLTRPLAEIGTPESVREVVSERLSRLAPETTALLVLAATAGAEFELATIRAAAGLDDPDLMAALDEAVASAMIEELPSRTLAYRFTHELVRRALYDRLTAVRRAELHLCVGEALEAGATPSPRRLADLAHHFAAAAPLGDAARGIEYNLLAARAAVAALDFEEAADRLRTAIELPIEAPAERAEAFIELGKASHRAGKALDSMAAFQSAAGIARELGDAELLARAAIGYEDASWRPGLTDQGAVELLEEAATALGLESSERRLALLAGLARALDFKGNHERGAAVRTSAVEMARELDDLAGLATVLVRSYWSRGTSSIDEILAMLAEAREIAEDVGNTEIRVEAMAWRVPALVALGDIEAARVEVPALLEAAQETAQPFMLHVAEHYGSAIALADGRLAEAEAMALRSEDWSRLLTGRDASGTFGIQMFSIRREQGRLAELAPLVRLMGGRGKLGGPWRPGLISLQAELGIEDEARLELARLADEGLESYRESLWLASLTYLADASAALGDQRMAALLYPELEPLTGVNVMIGHLVSCYGAADRYLGMLATTLGEWETAEEHFERALELNRRMGAATWVARTAHEYARLLLARPKPDRDRAALLLAEARQLAGSVGMKGLIARIDALGSAAPTGGLPDDLSPREAQILQLVAKGLSNREIGSALTISEHTAANHIRSILRKTDCANRTEAASYAHRHGIADL